MSLPKIEYFCIIPNVDKHKVTHPAIKEYVSNYESIIDAAVSNYPVKQNKEKFNYSRKRSSTKEESTIRTQYYETLVSQIEAKKVYKCKDISKWRSLSTTVTLDNPEFNHDDYFEEVDHQELINLLKIKIISYRRKTKFKKRKKSTGEDITSDPTITVQPTKSTGDDITNDPTITVQPTKSTGDDITNDPTITLQTTKSTGDGITNDNTQEKSKILLLGMSYIDLKLDNTTVENVIEQVRKGKLSQINGRDLARIISVEQIYNVDCYTVSIETSNEFHKKNMSESISIIGSFSTS